jgi:hypothetical protein
VSIRGTARRALKARLIGSEVRYDALRLAAGSIEARMVRTSTVDRIRDAEFTVFSQWGQDGIIQYLLAHVPIIDDTFVEFGVEDYRESNTRFLLMHDNWKGLIIDGGHDHLRFLEASGLRWRHSIDAVTAFVTRENINSLLRRAGVEGDIGLLSIDIDGNDYWVFEAIDAISPRIVIVEYNGLLGTDATVSIPYDPEFEMLAAHPSGLYFGASLPAMISLAERKGYRFVGTTSAGNDAFFVRADVADDLPALAPPELTEPRFRRSRDADGNLSYVAGREAQLALLGDMFVVDVITGDEVPISALR